MQISRITNSILKNKTFLKCLEKVSEHGTSFTAGASLLCASTIRPLFIHMTPDTEKENKQYAMSNSICSGLVKFGMVEAVALPVETAIKKIDKNPEKYLNSKTIQNLSKRSYKLITQTLKLSTGLITAIPKSVLTIALIPIIMDKLFSNKVSQKAYAIPNRRDITFESFQKKLSFTGGIYEKLSGGISKIIDNKKVQTLASKYETKDKDISKHITAGTDVLLTSVAVKQTAKSRDIKENRKKALIYNNIISTAITITGGYAFDSMIKNKTNKFIGRLKELNIKDPKVNKYIEGINIIRPALIFAGIYYGILPIFSTYMAEKIDKYIIKKQTED